MFQKLDISGVHMAVGDKLHSYVVKKIGQLDKYIPKHARKSAHVEVKLKEHKAKNKESHTCEVIVRLPHDVVTLNETAHTAFAAVDAAEGKLKNQLHKYKDMHAAPKLRQRLTARLKGDIVY
jgi:ribosomal subunit interface protein